VPQCTWTNQYNLHKLNGNNFLILLISFIVKRKMIGETIAQTKRNK
jgi:hypothetical protein